jgi:hypothetical protein
MAGSPISEGAPGLAFETVDIDTMQALVLIRAVGRPMTLPFACALSQASASASISTGKEGYGINAGFSR